MERSEQSHQENTLHHAIGHVLVVARIFGLMPLSGIRPSDPPESVRFHWLSPLNLVLVGVSLFVIGDFVLSAKLVLHNGFKIYTIGKMIYLSKNRI